MIFGMPRAVFPALGVGLFHGGAGVVGLLYAAPGAGALVGSLFTGWCSRVRRQGRAIAACVVVWGATIALFGVVPVLWIGLTLLALAGAADVVSAVFRQAVQQRTVPEHLQGRLSGTFFAVVAGGPRLGDAETGVAAAIGGPQFAVWSGGPGLRGRRGHPAVAGSRAVARPRWGSGAVGRGAGRGGGRGHHRAGRGRAALRAWAQVGLHSGVAFLFCLPLGRANPCPAPVATKWSLQLRLWLR